MSGNYDIHTVLLEADERALQKAHEIIGVMIENMKSMRAFRNERRDLEEARELIGSVLAATEEE